MTSQAPEKIIFACVHNAGRSQMAAAWFRHFTNPAKAVALSAGTQPAQHVHPVVAEAMQEVGISLEGQRPTLLTSELAGDARLLITMGCGENCPYVPGLEILDWPLPDPKGQGIDAVRPIRNEVRDRVFALLTSRGWAPSPTV